MSTILTERLIMRPFHAEDINYMIRLKGSATNMANTTVGPIDAAAAAAQLNDYQRQWDTLGIGMWALVHKASGGFVGECGFVQRDDLEDLSLRYTLDHSWWGKGLALEAVKAALNYGLKETGLKQVSALALSTNARSVHILEASGMRVVDPAFGGADGFHHYQLFAN